MGGARRCVTTVGRRFFQIRSLENYPVEVDRKVPAGAMCFVGTHRSYAESASMYIHTASANRCNFRPPLQPWWTRARRCNRVLELWNERRGGQEEAHRRQNWCGRTLLNRLRTTLPGTTLDRVLEWISSMHGYLLAQRGWRYPPRNRPRFRCLLGSKRGATLLQPH